MIDARQEFETAMMGESSGRPGGGLHFLNTTICPSGADGVYHVRTINLETALHCAAYYAGMGQLAQSHVGHEAACQAFGALGFGAIPLDRTPWDGYGLGLCLQLRGRITEGAILDKAQMDALGYDLRLIFRPPYWERGVNEVVQWALRAGIRRNNAYEAVEVFADLGIESRTEIRPWVDEVEDGTGEEFPATRVRPADKPRRSTTVKP
jgi:hypothetical protein